MSKNKDKIKKRKREGGSLMLRTWVYFVGMTLIILAVLWVTEFIMFRSYYNDMKEREITNECRSIANNFTGEVTPEYMHFVEQSVMDNTMRVTVFRIEGNADISEATNDNVRVLINVDPLDGHDKPLFPKENFIDLESEQDCNFYKKIIQDKEETSVNTNSNINTSVNTNSNLNFNSSVSSNNNSSFDIDFSNNTNQSVHLKL